MSNRMQGTPGQPPKSTTGAVLDGASIVVDEVSALTRQVRQGLAAFQTSVRSTPLIMSAVLLGVGYVIGSMSESLSRRTR